MSDRNSRVIYRWVCCSCYNDYGMNEKNFTNDPFNPNTTQLCANCRSHNRCKDCYDVNAYGTKISETSPPVPGPSIQYQ
ncbi:hypothetical protein IFR05_003274 [Cadophora sp. M221]|nr:hypothetical protein IFR05_003274 [Cadophora sp. M221]